MSKKLSRTKEKKDQYKILSLLSYLVTQTKLPLTSPFKSKEGELIRFLTSCCLCKISISLIKRRLSHTRDCFCYSATSRTCFSFLAKKLCLIQRLALILLTGVRVQSCITTLYREVGKVRQIPGSTSKPRHDDLAASQPRRGQRLFKEECESNLLSSNLFSLERGFFACLKIHIH